MNTHTEMDGRTHADMHGSTLPQSGQHLPQQPRYKEVRKENSVTSRPAFIFCW